MNNTFRLLLITSVMGLSVAACSTEEESTAAAPEVTTEVVETAVATPAEVVTEEKAVADTGVSAGMSEADVIAKLGEPNYTETSNLDALKITHSEWESDAGTTSVQFHNDVVAFSQFIPAAK